MKVTMQERRNRLSVEDCYWSNGYKYIILEENTEQDNSPQRSKSSAENNKRLRC